MFLWLDLETVGLDPDSGEILEVAWFISDNWELLTNVKSHVVTPTRDTFELIKQDMFAQTVHYDNLLLADLLWNRTVLLEDIEDMILRDLHRNNDQDVVPILAGSSVHFDRSFIRKYMPRLDDQLSHRHFDATTLMMFFNSLGYYDYGKREHSSTHRAYNDVQDSYKLARKYVNMMNLLVDENEDDNDAQRKSQ